MRGTHRPLIVMRAGRDSAEYRCVVCVCLLLQQLLRRCLNVASDVRCEVNEN